MHRLSVALMMAPLFAAPALAGDAPLPGAQQAQSLANQRCAALGDGFFAVTGSDSCVRISGRISAGANIGSRPSGDAPSALGTQHAGFDNEVEGAGEMRLDTPMGPARIVIDAGHGQHRRWVIDGQ